MDLHQDEFVAMASENLENTSEKMQPDLLKNLISYKNENKKLNLISNTDSIVFDNQSLIYELQGKSSSDAYLRNCLDCNSMLSFRVGIYEKEEYITYNKEASPDYIFVSWKKSFYLYIQQENGLFINYNFTYIFIELTINQLIPIKRKRICAFC